ncbi:energy-coupling factor transporter transmembrane component T [Candidatus Altiarchaeota archaeon]
MANAYNWMLWILLALLYTMLTYNPLYLGVMLSCLILFALARGRPLSSYLKLVVIVSVLPLFLNVFLVHTGDNVIYKIPKTVDVASYSVRLLFLSGNITAESVCMGLVMFLLLADMIVAFQLFNCETTPDDLISVFPSYLASVSMTVIISLRFIPQILSDYDSIRQAQVAKGYRFDSARLTERIRNSSGLLVPTLVTSLERGFKLSESMACRGYDRERTRYVKIGWSRADILLAGIMCLAIAWIVAIKMSGQLYFWPYESMDIGPLMLWAFLPQLALLSPLVIK